MAFLGQDMAAFLSLSNLSVEIRRDNVREPANEAFWFRFLQIDARVSNSLLAGMIRESASHVISDIQFYLRDVLHVPILHERKSTN